MQILALVLHDYTTINAAAEEKEAKSCLNYFRSITRLRIENPDVPVYGKYTLLNKNNPSVYSYTRESGQQKFLVVLNFTNRTPVTDIPFDISHAKQLINNYPKLPDRMKNNSIAFLPYEAVILKL